MPETPDYVYQRWLQQAFEDSSPRSTKGTSELVELVKMNEKLDRIIVLLARQGSLRPG